MPACHAVSSRSRTSGHVLAAALLVTLALAAGGCSSSDSSSPKTAPSGVSAGSGQAVAPSKLVLGKVAGTTKKKDRKLFAKHHRETLLKQVGEAVDSWIDGGFVGVDYPRDSFGSAFSAFTPPAKRDAKHQKKLMTNWGLRNKIDGVDVRKRVVTVDVLAPRGRPAGVTARVDLVFTTTGDTTERVTVRGRLFLSPGHGRWRVFGYDVSSGAR